jgi:bifunctional non-homologous end joining protein LigD
MFFKLFIAIICMVLLLMYVPGALIKNQQQELPQEEQVMEKKQNTKRKQRTRFSVQEHDATTHHFDLRIEIGDVLKSWAVPKMIPLEANEKRLAIQTEDHAISYIDFEGEIQEGFYGAGKVAMWDSGECAVFVKKDEKPLTFLDMLTKGVLGLAFFGKKMNGRYSLVRMKKKRGEKQTSWLLIKLQETV